MYSCPGTVSLSSLSDTKSQVSQNTAVVQVRAGRRGLGGRQTWPLRQPGIFSQHSDKEVVRKAISGCGSCSSGLPDPHCSLSSSGTPAMWGQGADPQTHWLGRWPHYRGIGNTALIWSNSLKGNGLTNWPQVLWREHKGMHPKIPEGYPGLVSAQVWAATAQPGWWERAASGPCLTGASPQDRSQLTLRRLCFLLKSQRCLSRQSTFPGCLLAKAPGVQS